MASKPKPRMDRFYAGAKIPGMVLRQYVKKVVAQFQPEKIILFGSRAYGQPHVDSDVDLLVVMPTRNELDQGLKIRLAIPAPFSLDLVVIKPNRLAERLEARDWFLREIIDKGKVLYVKDDQGMDQKAEEDHRLLQATENSVS